MTAYEKIIEKQQELLALHDTQLQEVTAQLEEQRNKLDECNNEMKKVEADPVRVEEYIHLGKIRTGISAKIDELEKREALLKGRTFALTTQEEAAELFAGLLDEFHKEKREISKEYCKLHRAMWELSKKAYKTNEKYINISRLWETDICDAVDGNMFINAKIDPLIYGRYESAYRSSQYKQALSGVNIPPESFDDGLKALGRVAVDAQKG